DLDLQLKKHGIHQLIVIGLIAHTCVEATVRFAAELGYAVTVVKDATADYGDEEMHAALDVNLPNYAAVVTTDEIIGLLSPREERGRPRGGAEACPRSFHGSRRTVANRALSALDPARILPPIGPSATGPSNGAKRSR